MASAPKPQPLADGAMRRARPNTADSTRHRLLAAFRRVRDETERRAAPLSGEDQVIQSMPDASPTKWHRAHTTWFFEQFLLVPHASDYAVFDESFAFLFNSYYVSAGPRHARPKRGLLTRPSVGAVADYRSHVDDAIARLIGTADDELFGRIAPLIEIGLHHEQQHQELMLTDILHAFAQNPTAPAYEAAWSMPSVPADASGGVTVPAGIYRIGHQGDGFSFDNEGPAHQVLLQTVHLGPLVTNADWLAFMADGAYGEPTLWLSDGWAAAQSEGWQAPEYWQKRDGQWSVMTLAGLKPVDPAAPVCHVGYYEADAFARWAGRHLPTEQEWEVAAAKSDPGGGTDLGTGLEMSLAGAFGVVWQWTRSAYAPYPGYQAAGGALGEYNGKFMVNQLVLRGSSLATPEGHERLTYRNFFYPQHRWQFAGLRLADYPDHPPHRVQGDRS